VVVFNDGERSVGLVVDQILDVAEEAVTVRQKSARKGLLGSAVVGKRVTDFLDLNHVIQAAAGDWFQGGGRAASGKRILVAEPSAFSRSLIRSSLDMEGYQVVEAANLDQAIRRLEQTAVDVVVTALDLPPNGGSAVMEAMRRRPEWRGIPVLSLADSPEQAAAHQVLPGKERKAPEGHMNFQDCQIKFDREGMLESVARLAAALAEPEPALAGKDR
jgi:two-component system, chemotaxis family, sensor kinase CheA